MTGQQLRSHNRPVLPSGTRGVVPGTPQPGTGPSKRSSEVRLTHVSDRGRQFIKEFEELRLQSYRDAVGIWTIGWGHTKGVGPGQTITAAGAEDLFSLDLMPVEKFVSGFGLEQNEFDAVCSLVFNVGIGAFMDSTTARLLHDGKYLEAANRIPLWNKGRKANGELVELPGLTRRRLAEADLFRTGNYGKHWS